MKTVVLKVCVRTAGIHGNAQAEDDLHRYDDAKDRPLTGVAAE